MSAHSNRPARLAALAAGFAAFSAFSQSLPGTDIRSWATADLSSKLSFAGTWVPVTSGTGGLVGPFWNVVKVGTGQLEGVALGGWVFNGSFSSTLPDVIPVRAALLAQQPDGTLLEASAAVLGNPITPGAGSVLVADFNGDGRDDLVFPAHNESPFLWKSSVAWMSAPGGGFTRITLPDAVMNHDARVVTLGGQKKILARSFGGSGNNGNGPGFNVIYTWNGSNFTVDTSLGDLGGMSILAGPFTANADNWLVVGDSFFGPGVPYQPTNPMLNYAYKYNGGVLTTPPILLPKPYFNDKPAYAGFASYWDPYSKTHTSRLWTTDLNQDGLPDILAGQEIWTTGPAGLQKAVFQLLLNKGGMAFEDRTDALAPEFSQDAYIDYNVRFADVDGSGIETMFHASNQAFSDQADAAKQGQYILVNDGTGRLYAAMHDEFRAMRTQIAAYLAARLPAGTFVSPNITPQFIAYRNAAGKLNFLAVVRYFDPANPSATGFVNVALGIDLETDFRRNLTIPTRNGSRRIRTFAGNDVIHRAVPDPDCAIDGGLGTNAVVYPGKRADWIITRNGAQSQVRPATGPGGSDTLTRIQYAVFEDRTVDLAVASTDGARLGNISTRGQVLTGNDVMIGGFIIGGTQPKTVVVRARGPSLIPFGIPNALANPRMDLYSGQTVIDSNDNWQAHPNAAALTASGFQPTDPNEAAIHATLNPGAYTAIVSGVGNTTGVGIVEVFEVNRPDTPLANISTRGQVLTVNDVMIGGFIIQGTTPQTVIVRARGPSLAPAGIANFLANPLLQVFSGQTQIAVNDDWQAAAGAAAIQAAGFAPADSREAAVLLTLSPGAYTAIVTGVGGTTGVGIVEVFAQ